MPELLSMLGRAFDLALVVIGFGLIIFVHELGHFVAARWAGIRVLAFALGFGPAALSYRKGLGFRKGSSEEEYLRRLNAVAAGVTTAEGHRPARNEISPTEYRLNVLPFGGYVKMLGQEDLNPEAVSTAPDSYQNCVPWKRMVVISAGVIMNIITAALIFMVVFKVGLRTEPAVVGFVRNDSPAAKAVAINAKDLGITAPGLQPGDEIVEIAGKAPRQFSDVVVTTAMSRRGVPLEITAKRPGVDRPLQFAIKAETSEAQRMLDIGLVPPASNKLFSVTDADQKKFFDRVMKGAGAAGVAPGSVLTSVGSSGSVAYAHELDLAARKGEPFRATFRSPDGVETSVTLSPRAEFEVGSVKIGERVMPQTHLLGLTGVLSIESVAAEGKAQGLEAGDVFVRLGAAEFPSITVGVREIRAAAGRSIEAVVRREKDGKSVDVPLTLQVSRAGTIGFNVEDTMQRSTLLGSPLTLRPLASGESESKGADVDSSDPKTSPEPTAAGRLVLTPGSVILAVDDRPVSDFTQIRESIREAIRASVRDGASSVRLTVQPPGSEGSIQVQMPLSPQDLVALQKLGWVSPISSGMFEPAQILLRASGPIDAVSVGLGETKRVMLMTYMTFVRLFEGSVKVEHLKGPVGIAHAGTLIADRGLVWLLFFMALISVNLAVVNFLPLPIVDGGQFLFILYEQIFRRPVPVGFQNAATLAGLVLIGSMFIVVTFNDIMNLFRS
ncbi:MAG: site-2 protease family protein [Phycisphaerales bacterium]|nr:site-2 protease family protein [Phycisphaerales bacterium]